MLGGSYSAKIKINKHLKHEVSDYGKKVLVKEEGVPSEIVHKNNSRVKDKSRVFGVSLGMTKNMGNFESLKVEVWANEELKEDETLDEGINRVTEELENSLNNYLSQYMG